MDLRTIRRTAANTAITRLPAALMALAMALALGCGDGGDSPTEPPPTVNDLDLVRVEPTANSAIPRTRVEVRARLRYSLASAQRGEINALVLGTNTPAPIFPSPLLPTAAVSRGSGEVDLNFSVTVPAGVNGIVVNYGLFPEGTNTAVTDVSVFYAVRD
jgi:hypothetical protein